MWHDLWLMTGALVPVFGLVALGWVILRLRLVTDQGVDDLNKLVFYVILPAQLFVMVSRADLAHHFDIKALVAALSGFAGGWLGSWLLTARLPAVTRGTMVSGVARPNAAFIGLPVMELVARTLPADAAQVMLTAFGVLLGFMITAFNVGTVAALRLAHHGMTWAGLKQIVIQMLTNPLIIACALGIGASLIQPDLLHGSLPGTTIELLAVAAIPTSLLLTGMQLDVGLVRKHPGLLTFGCIGKLLAVPALTLIVGLLLGVDRYTLTAAVILNACPVAVATVPMARMLGGDAVLMAALVVVSTIFAPLAMLIWLMALRSF